MSIITKGTFKALELTDFYLKVEFINPKNFISNINWSLSGDIPNGISINNNGIISGKILDFSKQDLCKNNNFPNEELNFDGSNWKNNGRFKENEFNFNIIIKRDILIKGPLIITEKSNIIILLIKCQDIDNKIFIRKYLNSTKKSKNNERTYLVINNKKYTDPEKAISAHKGPFKGD